LLGYSETETSLIKHLRSKHTVTQTSNESTDTPDAYDCVISYGYRHILDKKFLAACRRPPINLHLSLLPYNRGAHPNFWAWHDGTPHGVSIHHIDEGIDTGDIIVQKELFFKSGTTLLESYRYLRRELELLFFIHMDNILSNTYTPRKQDGNGTFHKKNELPKFHGGWNQTISDIKKTAPSVSRI